MNSIKSKLFIQIGILIFIMVGLLWIANQLFLSPYYINKVKNLLLTDYDIINQLSEYKSESSLEVLASIESETQMDMIIIGKDSTPLYLTTGSEYNRRIISQIDMPAPNAPAELPPNVIDALTFEGDITIPKPIGNISNIESIDDNQRFLWVDDPLFFGENLILAGQLDNHAVAFIRVPLAAIATSVETSNQFLLMIGVGIFIIGMIMAYMMAISFTKPITTITNITKGMKQLDFSENCPVSSNDEIGVLAENINELSLALSTNIAKLNHEIHEKNLINEKRKELLNNVSHELKTPLALMQGYAEGLKLNVANSTEKRDFYCDVIIDETKKMNNLVHQLLNINQIEFGQDALHKTKFNLSELLIYFIRKYEPLCDEKDIYLTSIVPEDIMVFGDAHKIELILTNYMVNAISYVILPNKISIELIEHLSDKTIFLDPYLDNKSDYAKKHIRVIFKNSALPIPLEEQSKLWDSFYKMDESRTRETGGHGLGLSIVKAIQDTSHNHYGMYNIEDGSVAFYFDIERI